MSPPSTKIKAVFFDFMGTCLNWHSSVVSALPSQIPPDTSSKLALEWRKQYFKANDARFRQNTPPEDIDITLANTLESTLTQYPETANLFSTDAKSQLIAAWHSQAAWPDVPAAIHSLRSDLGLEVFVHANGTPRLQLDLTRSSGLSFDMLFSSALLGYYKPHPEAYLKALQLVKLKPEEVVLVAAHAYDLRGAKAVGMKTVYVRRWTDDVDEDVEKVRSEFDVFLDDMETLPEVIKRL